LHDPPETEGGECHQLCLHHAHQASPGNQLVHLWHSGLGLISSIHGCCDICDRSLLEDDGQDSGHEGGDEHTWNGRLFGEGEVENNGHGQKQEDIEPEVGLQCLGDKRHGLGFHFFSAVPQSDKEIDRKAYEPGWRRGPEHVLDMVKEVRSCGDRSKIGHVRERRHLVSEVCTGHDGSCSRSERDSQANGNADESHSQSAYSAPGSSRSQGCERAYKTGRHQKVFGGYDLKPVVDDHRNGSAGDPDADQNADTEHDQDCWHSLVDAVDDAFFHLFPFEAEDEAEGARDKGCCHEENLGGDFVDSVADPEKNPHGD